MMRMEDMMSLPKYPLAKYHFSEMRTLSELQQFLCHIEQHMLHSLPSHFAPHPDNTEISQQWFC